MKRIIDQCTRNVQIDREIFQETKEKSHQFASNKETLEISVSINRILWNK